MVQPTTYKPAPMKIIAFADSHVCGAPSSWTSLFDKRVVGLFNYHYRRQHQHDQKWLGKMVEYVLDTKPDVAICAGDISTSGEPAEFETTCKALKPLVESSINFFFIPGNHDYYVKASSCINALKKAYRYLNQGKHEFDDLPYSVLVDDLDFCFVNESYPTNLVFSCGVMKKRTVKFVSRWVDQDNARPKVLVGHYPLLEKHPIIRFRHRLYGQKKIAKALRKKKIDLSLCGHVHLANVDIDDTGRGEIIIGSVTKNASGALIEYNKDKNIFTYKKIDLK